MEFGTVLAIAGLNLVIMGWLKSDIWKLNAMSREEIKRFQAEMAMFHREHAEMNKRILDLEMERKYGGKSS